MTASTQAVLDHHLEAFGQGLDPVMEDFTEASVLITDKATYRGLDQIRAFFAEMLANLPVGFGEALRIRRREVVGDVAFLLWDAQPWFPYCTDTLVVRDGHILCHTFASYRPA